LTLQKAKARRGKKGKRKGGKRKKIEGAPKGPTPAYFLYYKSVIAELKKDN
jgi:hypothetical protein